MSPRVLRTVGVGLVVLGVVSLAVLGWWSRRPVEPRSVRVGSGDPVAPSPPTAIDPTDPPAEPVRIEVGADLQAAVELAPEGTEFLIASGVHREQQVFPRDGMTFRGEPGAVLSGARVLDPDDFRRDGGRWVLDGVEAEGFVHGKLRPDRTREAHPEDLYVDGERWRHVESLADLDRAGEWFLDYPGDRLHLAVDPAGLGLVELATTEFAFVGPGVRDVTIENLTVRHYATWAQRGAINGRDGVNWTIRFVDASHNHGMGIGIGPGMHVSNSRISHNGQMGMGGVGALGTDTDLAPGEARQIRVTSNRIDHNLELGYDWAWEGGAAKFVRTSGMVFANNWVHDNAGPGPWFDIENEDATICANLVTNNLLGIFYEISFGAEIFRNTVRNNERDDPNAAAGIFISTSNDVEVWGNVVSGSPTGLKIIDRERGGTDDGREFVTTGVFAHDNVLGADDWNGLDLLAEDPGVLAAGHRFADNTYLVPSTGGRHWRWGTDTLGWDAWRDLGFDGSGEVLRLGGSEAEALIEEGVPPNIGFNLAHYGPLEDGQAPPQQPAPSRCDLSSLR